MTTDTARPLLEAAVGPVAYKVTGSDGVVIYLEKPLSFARHCTVPLYAIPEGWVLMPKEPTEEIRVAMAKARCEFDGDQGCDSLMKAQYRAAIAAGSVPPNA